MSQAVDQPITTATHSHAGTRPGGPMHPMHHRRRAARLLPARPAALLPAVPLPAVLLTALLLAPPLLAGLPIVARALLAPSSARARATADDGSPPPTREASTDARWEAVLGATAPGRGALESTPPARLGERDQPNAPPSGLSMALVRGDRIEPLPFVELPPGEFDVEVSVHLLPRTRGPAHGLANGKTF